MIFFVSNFERDKYGISRFPSGGTSTITTCYIIRHAEKGFNRTSPPTPLQMERGVCCMKGVFVPSQIEEG